jgi:phosphoglycolate phosphatase-like HAD superfamily hydrolase
MIRSVVFDFDGTLILSNEIKREGFFAAVSEINDGAAYMKVLLDNPEGDRYTIFNRFTDVFGASADDLVKRYTDWCEERIVICPEREGASTVIQTLRQSRVNIHLNSATPIDSLRRIVLRRYGTGYFSSVYGGHGNKRENLEEILNKEQLPPSLLAMVGDGIDDREAAVAVGCQFVGVGGGTLAAAAPDASLVDSLEHLWPLLRDEIGKKI